ncbi:putative cobalt-factor III C(17)-methyltransferase [Ruminococcaceae bacterium BL-6]|nr:putative cobalt-factor III C(17)-methyltransferase [Ruminococcaceae bacterium BL-6]
MKLYVIGIGPGEERQRTLWAQDALEECDVLVGYTAYIGLLRETYPEKELISTPMRTEADRCRRALSLAASGHTVGMVCSGDAGVYGMAGLMIELAPQFPPVEVEVVPGVTAATAGAAVLGAPLMNDFAVVSLSDLLTPWEEIEKRLRAASSCGFALCLYNPSSRRRAGYLKRACEIILESRGAETVCGYVRNIGRAGQASRILTLRELAEVEADMFTTVFVGTAGTKVVGGKMVTPRGYRL